MKTSTIILAAAVAIAGSCSSLQAQVNTLVSPAGGTLPAGVSSVGGIVVDFTGLNGTRLVSQLSANGLFKGFVTTTDQAIGTQTGFTQTLLSQLGGGLTEAAFRVTLLDGDSASGDFDFDDNALLANGISIGNFSTVATVETDGLGTNRLSDNLAGGFRDERLDTGFFLLSSPADLSALFTSIGIANNIAFTFRDFDPVESGVPDGNFLDFTLGVDASLINIGSGPTVVPPVVTPPVTPPVTPTTPVTPPVFVEYMITDLEAETSLVFSGLPTAAALRQIEQTVNTTALRDVNGRLFRHRAGQFLHDSAEDVTLRPETVVFSKDDKTVVPPIMKNGRKWDTFANVDYGNADLSDLRDQAGSRGDTWSGSVGVEYSLTRQVKLGLNISYVYSDQNFSQGRGGLKLEGPTAAAYAAFTQGPFWIDALYAYTDSQISVSRGSFQASGKTDSQMHNVQLNTGWNFSFAQGKIITGPILAATYSNGEISGYNEVSGGNNALSYSDQDFESLVTTVGWQASFPISFGAMKVIPQVRASWERENLDESETISASLRNSPFYTVTENGIVQNKGTLTATQETQNADQDYLLAGAGVQFLINSDFSVILDYDGRYLRSGLSEHFASAHASVAF